jgi:excisionase family DNA binding protein
MLMGDMTMRDRRNDAERLTYDIPEVARKLGLTRQSAYSAAKAGDIPTIKVGGRILVPRVAFDRMLETGRVD